jgi:hypothetical protein
VSQFVLKGYQDEHKKIVPGLILGIALVGCGNNKDIILAKSQTVREPV